MNIITNHQPRLLLWWDELTHKEQEQFADFEDKEGGDYVRYRGRVYSIGGEFMYVKHDGWDGSLSTSMWTGICIKFVERDYVIMGRWSHGNPQS